MAGGRAVPRGGRETFADPLRVPCFVARGSYVVQIIRFKAELRDLNAARLQCRVLRGRRLDQLRESDVLYALPDGRLERRDRAGQPSVWVFSHEAEDVRPVVQTLTVLSDAQVRMRWGQLSDGAVFEIERERWTVMSTTVALEEVAGLGTFIEFTAQLRTAEDMPRSHARIRALRREFAPILGEAVAGTFVGLGDDSRTLR